ncbi:MAG: D-alanyl-D-alanine carboxypeptidase/D-alanyl-D-alanine endopeptidase [Gemmatimonadales bacterium]
MKLVARALWLALLTGVVPPVFARSEPIRVDKGLQEQLETWYRRAARVAPGTWGIAVASLDGQLLWAVQPTLPMIPASTVKLFTTGFARSVLGGEARRITRVLGTGHLDPFDGTWVGSWQLELNGDPTLERAVRGGPSFLELAQSLRDQGIRRLSGPLLLTSASGETNTVFPSAWDRRHQGRYFAPLVGNAVINEGLVTFSVGPGSATGKLALLRSETPLGVGALIEVRAKTVAGRYSRLRVQRAPTGGFIVTGTIGRRARTRWFTFTAHDTKAIIAAVWARALQQAGIEWDHRPDTQPTFLLAAQAVLAQVRSSPFDSIAMEVNRRSVNVGAELLLRWAAGNRNPAELLTEHVRQVTGDWSGVKLVDGSGLSRLDRVTPLAFITYLAKFPVLPAGKGFPLLLPANGMGTLRKLATGLPAAGVLRAKTGTLGDAATVVGYLGRPDGVLLLSVMYNGRRATRARQEQWRLFRLLGAQGVILPEDSLGIGGQLGGGGERDTVPNPDR